MKRYILILAALVAMTSSLYAQDEKKTAAELASDEAEEMATFFHFTDYQLYQADSLLQENYPKMVEELEKLSKAGAQNQDLFLSIQEKYMELIDDGFEKILTPEQWTKYMKSAYGKAKRKREEDKIKAEKKQNKKR